MSPSAADRATAVVLAALGAAMAVGGWTMDRLEVRRIHPASIPGLVPMLLGVALCVCAALLWRSAGAGARADAAAAPAPADAGDAASGRGPGAGAAADEGTSAVALAFAALWSGFYALGLVGTLPFVLATTLYVAGFVLFFEWRGHGRPRPARVAFALGFAVLVAGTVAVLFRYAFLVRLP